MHLLPFAERFVLGCRLVLVRTVKDTRASSTTVHCETRLPASAWAARPSATSAPAFACHRHRLRLLNRQRCVAATLVRRNPVPVRCHSLQAPSKLTQAPAVAHQRHPSQAIRAVSCTQPSPRFFAKCGLALEAPARVNVRQFVGAAAKGGSEFVARQRPGAQLGVANSPPSASHHARPGQGTIAPVRPNPSFNLTFSGWLRQPPNAS
jgi:hypothetical protein